MGGTAASEARWLAAASGAGYRERSVSEWMDHPTALDDLLRVMGGTRIVTIDAERQRARDRRAA